METKTFVTRNAKSIEAGWMRDNLFRDKGVLGVEIQYTNEAFRPEAYLSKRGFDRYLNVRNGTERTLNRLEYASVCYRQQVLEVLFCLFVKYEADFPADACFDIGVSKNKLFYSEYGHVYSDWIRLKIEHELYQKAQFEREGLLSALEFQDLKLKDMMRSSALMEAYRLEFSNNMNAVTEVWDPKYVTNVALYDPDSLIGPIVQVGFPDSEGFDSEGVEVGASRLLARNVDVDQVAEYVVSSVQAAKEHNFREKMNFEGPVNPIVLEFEEKNSLPERDWLKPKGGGEWKLPIESVCMLNKERSKDLENCDTQQLSDDAQALMVISTELTNEESLKGEYFEDLKPFSNSHFKNLWDLHKFVKGFGHDVILSVSWGPSPQSMVERVIILDIRGFVLMDMRTQEGANYLQSLYMVRREAYMLLFGSNIYGFNVFQHLARLGFGGARSQCVDMSMLPMLKGRLPLLSLEKYQMRYGRSVVFPMRVDPSLDNALFCVFLVRRDGMNWRIRRKRRI